LAEEQAAAPLNTTVCRNMAAEHAIILPALDGNDAHQQPSEVFRFEFGQPGTDAEGVIGTGLRCFGTPGASEAWLGTGPVSAGRDGRVKLTGNADFLLGHVSLELSGPERLAELGCAAYLEIVTSLRGMGFPHLVRTWNFMPYINAGRDDTEGYRQFCVGRAVAISTLGLTSSDLPAATGVGTPRSRTLVVAVLGSRQRARHLENPRQVPAYRYPRQYGPRSPSFARASLISGADDACLFIAGTASVVGHDSLHYAQAARQTVETFTNIREVLAVARQETSKNSVGTSGGRVYVRNEADLLQIEEVVAGAGVLQHPPLYVEADICRTELLVEIELVTRMR
jgi:chorismate lyase / 3-hydroxybenzoate synthase